MTVPLGNTPAPSSTPEELKTPGLVWMAKATERGEPPVIMFYRLLEQGSAFAPDPKKIDAATREAKLVYPVTVDVYFPNGPLAGRVYRRVGFINAGLTGSIRQTAIGSINVGQLNIATGQGNPYAQLNALDEDALAWANKIHQSANGNVFAAFDPRGEISAQPAPSQPQQPAPQVDRFAGMPTPGAQQQPAPQYAQQQPAGPPPGMVPAAAQQPAGPPPGMPGAPATNGAQHPGQPAPTTAPAPAGVPSFGPPPGMPGVPAAVPAAAAPDPYAGIGQPPY